VIEEPFLHDFNNGYMIADPVRNPAWMVGMLQGNTTPQLWRSAPEMTSIGGGTPSQYQLRVRKITWEVEWDIGVAAVDPDNAYMWGPA
jgi:hypothetical protein